MAASAGDVLGRVAEVLGTPRARVQPEVPLTDLVSDSYRLVEVAIELQDDYDVILSQSDLAGVTTVGDLVDLIRRRT